MAAIKSRDRSSNIAMQIARGVLTRFAVVVAWALLILVFWGLRGREFLSADNFSAIFGTQAFLVVITLAVLFPIICGELDLSVASLAGLTASIIGELNGVDHYSIVISVIVGMFSAIGAACINGVIVVFVGLNAFVATLGLSTLWLGVAEWITNFQSISGINTSFVNLLTSDWLNLPIAFYLAMVLAVVCWYILRHTVAGRYIAFIGANRDAARLSGVNVRALRFLSFAAEGVLCAIAGCIAIAAFGGYQSTTATTFLLPAMSAAFLSTTVIDIGKFNVLGAVIGIYFLTTGINGLELMGLSSWVQDVFYGGALVLAVWISLLGRGRNARPAIVRAPHADLISDELVNESDTPGEAIYAGD
jgi:ribose transport system permease protein